MSSTRFSKTSTRRRWYGQHRFEHWYRDNQIYFITARVRDRCRAFASDQAKAIFWEAFDRYTTEADFVPIVTSLLDNHYHTLGYLREGDRLKRMMQGIHGCVSKRVNDLLETSCGLKPARLGARLVPFWLDRGRQIYFDGCIRNEKQCRRTYRYILLQAVRAGLVDDWHDYPHTQAPISIDAAVKRAVQLGAFLEGVPYRRYDLG